MQHFLGNPDISIECQHNGRSEIVNCYTDAIIFFHYKANPNQAKPKGAPTCEE
jgi:hypothetical protein